MSLKEVLVVNTWIHLTMQSAVSGSWQLLQILSLRYASVTVSWVRHKLLHLNISLVCLSASLQTFVQFCTLLMASVLLRYTSGVRTTSLSLLRKWGDYPGLPCIKTAIALSLREQGWILLQTLVVFFSFSLFYVSIYRIITRNILVYALTVK